MINFEEKAKELSLILCNSEGKQNEKNTYFYMWSIL